MSLLDNSYYYIINNINTNRMSGHDEYYEQIELFIKEAEAEIEEKDKKIEEL